MADWPTLAATTWLTVRCRAPDPDGRRPLIRHDSPSRHQGLTLIREREATLGDLEHVSSDSSRPIEFVAQRVSSSDIAKVF
jgi:hypothetical protein